MRESSVDVDVLTTPLTASPQSPSPVCMSQFVRSGSAAMARWQARVMVAERRFGLTGVG